MRHQRWRECAAVAVFLVAGTSISAVDLPSAYGGNLEMVEERTEELDTLNRQAVGQIPEALPRDGQIELTADVVELEGKPRVDVQKYKIRTGDVLRNHEPRVEGKSDAVSGGIPPLDSTKR